jgi:hypothetical protein
MLNLSDIYKDCTVEDVPGNIREFKTMLFQCEHCDQEFSFDALNIAIFLYGVLFLTGKDSGYFGFNCPKCLNTLLINNDTDFGDAVCQRLLKGFAVDSEPTGKQLRYFSSVNYAPKVIPGLGAFEIETWVTTTFSLNAQQIQKNLNFQYQNYPELEADYLCSYLPVEEMPSGVLFTVNWFKEDQIEKLVAFENRRQLKVFPRYFYQSDLLNQMEFFCWKNYLHSKWLSDGEKSAEEDLRNLTNIAEFQGWESKGLLKSNPEIGPVPWNILQENMNDDFDWKLTGEFMQILADDPDPFPFHPNGGANKLLKSIWKTRHPFNGQEIPSDIYKIDPAKYSLNDLDTGHKDIISLLQGSFHLEPVQRFLGESVQPFIKDYIKIARKWTFSYADFWETKQQYLEQLFDAMQAKDHVDQSDIMETNKPIENHPIFRRPREKQFGFFKEGASYRLIYAGKEFTGLKKDGFMYLYYLVQNKGIEFTPAILYQILKGPSLPINENDLDLPGKDNMEGDDDERHDFDRVDKQLAMPVADFATFQSIEPTHKHRIPQEEITKV